MYSTDYNDFAIQTLPPNYRLTIDSAWAKARLAPMVWANSVFFEDFIVGSNYSQYDVSTTYGYQDRVIYHKEVYESLQDGNTGNAITDGDWWIKINTNFIGVYERIAYNATKLLFEYALNKYFGGTFAQPPSVSDIYITNVSTDAQSFVVGLTDEASSAVGVDTSTGFIGNTTVYDATVDFEINIPAALYPSGGDEEIRQFADLINTAGLTYNIVQY